MMDFDESKRVFDEWATLWARKLSAAGPDSKDACSQWMNEANKYIAKNPEELRGAAAITLAQSTTLKLLLQKKTDDTSAISRAQELYEKHLRLLCSGERQSAA